MVKFSSVFLRVLPSIRLNSLIKQIAFSSLLLLPFICSVCILKYLRDLKHYFKMSTQYKQPVWNRENRFILPRWNLAISQRGKNSEGVIRYVPAGLISWQKEAIKGVCFVIVAFTMTLNDFKFFPSGEGILQNIISNRHARRVHIWPPAGLRLFQIIKTCQNAVCEIKKNMTR